MSGLGYKLGPQGHQLLNSNNASKQISYVDSTFSPKFQLPSELDYLLYDIANPGPSTSTDKIFSYLVYYYPRLKNVHNVKLLTTHFLKCPLFFGSTELMTLENMTKIIECYQYIVTSKYKISNPSVPFHEFYSSIYDSIRLFLQQEPTAYWKVLPILAGCISAIKPMKLYSPYPSHSNVIASLNTFTTDLFSDSFLLTVGLPLLPGVKDSYLISLLYAEEHLSDSFYNKLSKTNYDILPEFMRILFFSKNGLDKGSLLYSNLTSDEIINTMPTLRSLNKWAFLYKKLSRSLPSGPLRLHEISNSINYIVSFSTNISSGLDKLYLTSDKWDLVKYIFFTIVMIFEQATTMIVLKKSDLQKPVFVISTQIIRSFFHLSYILDKIGTGGFDSYNFIFNSTTLLLAEHNPDMAESFLYSLLNEIPISKQQTVINDSKLVFFLRTAEATLQSLKKPFKDTTLFPLLKLIFTNDTYSSSALEFSYSIMVKHLNIIYANDTDFKTDDEFKEHLQNTVFPFFNQVLSQFPKKLSLSQASLIIQTCGRVASLLHDDSAFFNNLLDLIRFQTAVSAYTPLRPKKIIMNGNEAVMPEKLHTRRAGLVSFYIDLLQYSSFALFVDTLEDIKCQIDKLTGSQDIYALYDHLWDTLLLINKFDCQKGQLGLDWWYRTINLGLVPKL